MSDDPMDMPLPCDVKCGSVTFSKGVSLRTLVNAAARWKAIADKAYLAQTPKLTVPKSLCEIFGPGVPHDR